MRKYVGLVVCSGYDTERVVLTNPGRSMAQVDESERSVLCGRVDKNAQYIHYDLAGTGDRLWRVRP